MSDTLSTERGLLLNRYCGAVKQAVEAVGVICKDSFVGGSPGSLRCFVAA